MTIVLKIASGFSGSVILRYQPLKFLIPIVLDITGSRKCRSYFVGKCLKISQKLHGGDSKHIKVCTKTKKTQKLTDELFFTPCQFQLSKS